MKPHWLGALLTAATLGATAPLLAEEGAPVVPVDTVVADALAHSPGLRAAHLAVVAAEAHEREAGAAGLPSLDLEARAGHFEGLKDFEAGPDFTIREIPEQYAASATLTQPLYTGGRIHERKKRAALQRDAAEATRRSAEADIVLQATEAYWNWSKAHYALDSLRAAVARMEAHHVDVANQRDAGLATDNEALAADVRLQRTILLREEALRENRLARARITFLTGHEIPAAAVPAQATTFPVDVPDEDAALRVAQAHRAERQARDLEAQASESATDVARSDFYPQFFLSADYEQARPNNRIFPPEDEWQDVAFAGLIARWNLLDWGLTRSQVNATRADAARARLRLQYTEEQIGLEVREARADVEDALARVPVNERAEFSARRNLEVAADLWHNGLTRHAEVLDAHSELTEAQYELIAARADVLIALARLAHAQGTQEAIPAAGNE